MVRSLRRSTIELRGAASKFPWIVGLCAAIALAIAFVLFTALSRDSARRLADRAVREREAQFRIFAETMPNHVWTSPPDGLLDWFNEQTYKYSGVKHGELDGHGWARIVHPEDLAAAAAIWAKSLSSGEPYQAEFRLRRADGMFRWHVARALPIYGSAGEITRWIGTNTDIDDQKNTAAALAHLNETLEQRVEELIRGTAEDAGRVAAKSEDGVARQSYRRHRARLQ